MSLDLGPPSVKKQDLKFSEFFSVTNCWKSWKIDDFLCMNVLNLGVLLFWLQNINSGTLKVPEVKGFFYYKKCPSHGVFVSEYAQVKGIYNISKQEKTSKNTVKVPLEEFGARPSSDRYPSLRFFHIIMDFDQYRFWLLWTFEKGLVVC